MKIGQFVQHAFRDAFKKGLISLNQIRNLQELQYSINTFNSRYEVLRANEKTIQDENGRNRYYTKKLFCGDYYLTSQWVEPQWDLLLKWLNGIGYEINESELKEIEIPIIKNEKTTISDSKEIEKVIRKIPNWFNNPDQLNSKILISYLVLLGKNKSVLHTDLANHCKKIKTFTTNYNQMKTISINNHAKVFDETGGVITLWLPVEDFIKQEYEKIKNL